MCHSLTLTLPLPVFLALRFSVVRCSRCEIASPPGSYSITPGSSPQQNRQSTQGENECALPPICHGGRRKKNIPSIDNEWTASWVMGASMSWLTSQGQNETFRWPIYVIGGAPNDVLEERWVFRAPLISSHETLELNQIEYMHRNNRLPLW